MLCTTNSIVSPIYAYIYINIKYKLKLSVMQKKEDLTIFMKKQETY